MHKATVRFARQLSSRRSSKLNLVNTLLITGGGFDLICGCGKNGIAGCSPYAYFHILKWMSHGFNLQISDPDVAWYRRRLVIGLRGRLLWASERA
jgi:hypothetical protein